MSNKEGFHGQLKHFGDFSSLSCTHHALSTPYARLRITQHPTPAFIMDWPGTFRPEPFPEYFWDHPEHMWEAEKFGMDHQDVFTTLAMKYNCFSIPLLDSDVFRRDVSYISGIARNRDEFHNLLQQRRDERQTELVTMFDRGLGKIIHNSHLISEDHMHNWGDVVHISHFNSFDAIVRFFANYLPISKREAAWTRPQPFPPAATASTDPTPRTSPPDTTSTIPINLALPSAALPQEPPRMPSPPAPGRRQIKDTGMSRGVRSGRVQKPTQQQQQQQQQGPRRSSRLQQKKEHLKHYADLQPHTGTIPQTAIIYSSKRKSSENDEDDEPQAIALRSKRRKITPSIRPPLAAAKSAGERKSPSDEIDEPRAIVSGSYSIGN
ncbi:hypothetical protein VM1G_10629 [Cytospora mali]|uniref:Uncharacterized protein n=1 Tax=Cytospora mali TaxID=578113 RepID=A0A194VI56_CYTMA|nr:hypothetical protein VM1G_10629 [Valsa mali]